jgi:ABC-type branched-subunit amino acid transport system ATPase component
MIPETSSVLNMEGTNMPSRTEAVITCHKINTFRGPVHALRDVTLTVHRGITCLVGPNGAGKTTLLKSMMGLLRVSSGTITFQGRDITNIKTNKIAGLGIGYVPEDRRIYPDFTVRENILLGTWRRKVQTEAILDQVHALFPKLKQLSRSMGLHLSGGEKGMLAIARTLALQPSCLLLDEPLEGLAPTVRKDLAEKIDEFRSKGITTIVTASDMSYVPEIADTTYTLERGEIAERTDKTP